MLGNDAADDCCYGKVAAADVILTIMTIMIVMTSACAMLMPKHTQHFVMLRETTLPPRFFLFTTHANSVCDRKNTLARPVRICGMMIVLDAMVTCMLDFAVLCGEKRNSARVVYRVFQLHIIMRRVRCIAHARVTGCCRIAIP